MKQALFATTIVLLVMSVLASTASADYTCYGNSSQFSTTVIASGNSTSIAYNETCNFGCNSVTGSCNIYDPISSSLSGIALLIVAAIFSIIATKVSSGISFRGLQVEVLQPLFFTISIFMILIAFTIMTTGASGTSQIGLYNQLNAGYNTVMYVFIFFISFMVISFIVNIIMKAGKSA